ncbi:cobalamin biosynthesis protein, partial [Candidatus Oleimmundimicrobium sp.]|uniref:cobalamin biosynthesis protein n=1 Tax=Candidatus Oleimmundimicrobium sp. TaxID=3060597 RepID=UPI00271B9F65
MNEIVLQVLIAFILDMTIADPAFLPHPVRLIGFLITKAEDILRCFFKDKLEYLGGLILTVTIVAFSYFFVHLVLVSIGRVSSFLSLVLGAYFIYVSMA